jgi:hypothetical protein
MKGSQRIGIVRGIALLVLGSTAPAQDAAHPDFSGIYMPNQRLSKLLPFGDKPYTPWAKQYLDDFLAHYNPVSDEPSFFCVAPGMPLSMTMPAPFPLEIIQRPQDLTLFFEAYSQYRKIYIDGYPRPDLVLPTHMGYSVGHWEGDTLVVETTGLAELTVGSNIVSEEATITERMRIETDASGTRRLIDEIVYSDPKALTQTLTARGVWNASADTPILEYVCSQEIYDNYLERVRAEKSAP